MSRSLAGDLRALAVRIRRVLEGVPGWLAGVLVGVQAAALGLLAVLAPAWAAIAAAPASGGSVAIDWSGAAGVAIKLWLLAHTVPIETDQATFSLVPLGLTFVCAAILAALARRFAAKSWGSWLLAVGSYAGVVAATAAVVWAGSGAHGSLVVRAAVAAVVIAGPSVAWGIWRAHGAEFGWVTSVPPAVRIGVRLGLGSTALLVLTASAVAVVWAFVGSYAMADAASALGPDAVGGLSLAIAQTMYAAVIVVWMLAWLTGLGFSVGETNLYAPSVVATDALPTIPILGALPNAAGGPLVWAPLLVVAVAAFAWATMRTALSHWRSAVGAGLVAVSVVALALWALMALATGSGGPGRLAVVGPDPGAVAVVGAALVAMGFAFAAAALAGVVWARGRYSGTTTP
ncbi:MAG: hypothetical protein CVT64_09315 [Actinobacteria bacterium HGW-Actinobacteria-4]|nr:MAG: hypothetical protein CVT64_09315 [Actinobacteria bacterium HGW-Actinobacteria-4]